MSETILGIMPNSSRLESHAWHRAVKIIWLISALPILYYLFLVSGEGFIFKPADFFWIFMFSFFTVPVLYRIVLYIFFGSLEQPKESMLATEQLKTNEVAERLVKPPEKVKEVSVTSKLTQKNKFLFAKLFMALGGLMAISGNVEAGLITIFGSLAYMSRKKQMESVSQNWGYAEVASVVIVILVTSLGFFNDYWYDDPLTFVIMPLIAGLAYGYTYLKQK